MRHFAGILLGIVFIPVFFGLNWLVNYTDDRAGGDPAGWSLVLVLGAYVLVGLVAAVLLASRSISPLALLLCGLGIATLEVLLFLPRLAGVELNVSQLYGYPSITNGYLLVAVAAAMIVAGFFPSRWHRPKPKAVEGEDEGPIDDREMLPMPDEQQPARDASYDASWGSGRNEYAEEPETPYVTRQDAPATQQLPVTQPGQYDQPPMPVSEAGHYDQQALGYGQFDEPTVRYQQPAGSAYEEPATAEFDRPVGPEDDPYGQRYGYDSYQNR